MADPRGFLKHRERVARPSRPVPVRIMDFKDVHVRQDEAIVRTEASRCMDCGVPFCHAGCPLGNLIPEFNDLVYRDDWDEAGARLEATNNFPEFTGRLCPAPCETACVLGIIEQPVTIKQVEISIIDRAWEEGWVTPQSPESKTGKSVAVVGSGPSGLAAAQQLTRAGHDVVVVSASISEMVAPIARLVGADRAVATHMEVGEDGLFTGRISRSMLHSEKVVALHEDAAAHGIDPARCWAYSDSISDEPMLSAVGHPVAVNPDRDLRRLAQERDWPVRDFARPVRLRPRWEPPSLSTRASVIAHVAGVLAVGGTAAWLMARRRPRGARGL